MSWPQQWSSGSQPSVPPVLNPATPVINSAPAVVPPGLQYTPDQWAQLQQQNWNQWAQWQQQYQQWHQQYGAEYQKSINAMAQAAQQPVSGLPNVAVPPPLPVDNRPPLPTEDPPPNPSYSTAPPPNQPPNYNTGPPPSQPTNYNTVAPVPKPIERPTAPLPKNNQNWQPQNPRFSTDSHPIKRSFDQANDHDAKRPIMNKLGWQNQPPPLMQQPVKPPKENIEELSEAEKKFDKQFAEWEAQFNKWKEQNAEHPDKEQYREYEKKWESWRAQLLERREQMKRKRLGLPMDSPNRNRPGSAQNRTQSPQQNLNPSQQSYNQPQPNFNQPPPKIGPPKSGGLLPTPPSNASFNKPPPTLNDEPLKFKQPKSFPEVDDNVGDFIKPNTSGGIPGLDLVKDDPKTKNETEDVVVIDPDNEKRGPDFDAISKGINTILGDQKLLNMLSIVSQNQNSKMNDNLTNTVSRIKDTSNPDPSQVPYQEQSNHSYEDHSNQSEGYGQREFVNNFDDQTRSSFTMTHNEQYDAPGNFGRNPKFDQNQFPDRFGNFNKNSRFGGPPENDQFNKNNFGRNDFNNDRQFPARPDNSDRFSLKGDVPDRGFPPGPGPSAERFGSNNERSFEGQNQDRFGPNQERFGPGPNQERLGPNQERFGTGPNQERLGPTQERFGNNPDRFKPNQNRFGPNQDRFAPNQDRFGSGQDRFGPNQARFGPNQDKFGPNDRFGPNQDKFGPNQDRFGTNQDKFGSSQDRFGTNQDKFGPNQDRFGPNQDKFGSNQDKFGSSQDRFGPNQDKFGSSQDKFGPNQDRFGPNQDRFPPKQDRFGPNYDRFGPNQDRFGTNEDRFGSNQSRFGQERQFPPPRNDFRPNNPDERFDPRNEGNFNMNKDRNFGSKISPNERQLGPKSDVGPKRQYGFGEDDFNQYDDDEFNEGPPHNENFADNFDYDEEAANYENDPDLNMPMDQDHDMEEPWKETELFKKDNFNEPPPNIDAIVPEDITAATAEPAILQPTTVIDYDHKTLKVAEPEILIEPIYMFDYRHKPLSRLPLPQRPKWLSETVKNIREFNPPVVRPYEPQNMRRYPPPVDNWRKERYQEDRWSPHNRRNYNENRTPYEERRPYTDKPYEEPKNLKKDWSPTVDNRKREERRMFGDDRNTYQEERKQLPFKEQNDFDEDKISDPEWPDEEETENFQPKHNMEFPKFQKPDNAANKVMNKTAVLIEDLISPPGRYNRPPRIVIILRGPPGSGKTFLAKLIKDKEVENGGSTPRILSLDDYFMVEQEKEVTEEGKRVKIKEMVYEYEAEMEESYRTSLIKSFRKTITDGYFSFIIVDNVNDKVKYFGEMWSFAKQNGFQVYICQLDLDAQTCSKRNIHGRSESDIEKCVAAWEPTPYHHPVLDATSLLQTASIPEVEMEEVNSPESDTNDRDGSEDQVARSKWDNFDCSVHNLAKLDGVSKPLRHSTRTMEEYLQLDTEWTPVKFTRPGQKRVRWADLEEQKQQEKMRAIGFVVGQTNWDRMMDPTMGSSALIQTKYIERTGRYKVDQK